MKSKWQPFPLETQASCRQLAASLPGSSRGNGCQNGEMMLSRRINDILGGIKVSIEDPRFFSRVFTLVCQARKRLLRENEDAVERVFSEEYDGVSRRLDRSEIQESCSVRNVLRTRKIASLAVQDDGRINKDILPILIKHLKRHLYFIGPNRQFDGPRQEHILHVLCLMADDEKILRQIQSVGKPFRNPFADQIIRETLDVEPGARITDAMARRAVLTAWLCYLRQNVGSCFATAPAIIVHDEQPSAFLNDLSELMGTGRMRRTFGGRQYSVPMSKSWGAGDLKRRFRVPKEAAEGRSDLWLSPGLVEAFESVKLIEKEVSLKEKTKFSKRLIVDYLTDLGSDQPYLIISPEEVIRGVLLRDFNLTEADIEEYENRPVGMIHGGLLMQVAASGGGKKKQECAKFLEAFGRAKIAYKSLSDNALLKAWEFTVASFAETKAQFTRWNLYSSLGLAPEDQGGIGQCVFNILKQKLDETNSKVHSFQDEYEQVYGQLKYLEGRVRNASSEKEAKWIRAEYQSRRNEFRTLEELRNRTNFRARRFANLFNELIDIYYQMFPRYFQEVYDADIHDVAAGPYDDSPAGFRLLFKHGRSNPSQWTLIYNQNQFVDALCSFFTSSEREICSFEELQGLEDDYSEIVTAIVSHLKTKEFLESALYRMAAAHRTRIPKNPLENMNQVEKKPWVYTSGGAMNTLVSCYFGREENPTEVDRWIENPMELLVWLADIVKQMPVKAIDAFESNPDKGVLIHSPTHAFLLKPGQYPFSELWQSEKYTYTWIRDEVILPMKEFVDRQWLEDESMRQIVKHLSTQVPKESRDVFIEAFSHLSGRLSSVEFRQRLVDGMQKNPKLCYGRGAILEREAIDGALFSLLPFFPGYQLRDRIANIIEHIQVIDDEVKLTVLEIFEEQSSRIAAQQMISAEQLQDVCKALLCLALTSTSVPYDIHLLISRAAQELGYAMPAPVAFADTNWVKDLFGFVINPGTGELELWRVDYTGRCGFPMSMWSHWLDGSRRDIKWGVYTRVHEYVAPTK